MPRPDLLAAVDLGSNSFHLQVGRVVDGQIYPLDTLREVVRLGAGLTSEKRIDRATQARALEALERIGERLRGLPRSALVPTARTAWRGKPRSRSANLASASIAPACVARSMRFSAVSPAPRRTTSRTASNG